MAHHASAPARWTETAPRGGRQLSRPSASRTANHAPTPVRAVKKRFATTLVVPRQHRRRHTARAAVVCAGESGATVGEDEPPQRQEGDRAEDETGGGDIEIPERPAHVRWVDGFLDGTAAEDLRGVFDAHHAEPTRVHEYRFVWDYWHVPDQYTLLRTPAADYFPKGQYDQLVRRGLGGGRGKGGYVPLDYAREC